MGYFQIAACLCCTQKRFHPSQPSNSTNAVSKTKFVSRLNCNHSGSSAFIARQVPTHTKAVRMIADPTPTRTAHSVARGGRLMVNVLSITQVTGPVEAFPVEGFL